MPRLLVALLALGATSHLPAADKLLPADKPVETVIDHYVDAELKANGVEPAPQTDDAALVRRLTLDLVGRIPTPVEVDAYVGSADPAKRAKLVDRLMASPGFVRFQAQQFDTMLNSTVAGDDRRQGSVRDYLQAAIKDGKTWDAIFRDLLLPAESDPKAKSAAAFLKARVRDADRLTNDVSVAFFGVNVSCAQCHDHPLVEDWKQDHFYGLKSFLERTYDAGGFLAEREAGLIKFKPTKGPERQARLMFLTGATVQTDTLRELSKDEQKKEKELGEKAKSAKTPPPAPTFSARAKLVELALQPEEAKFFSKSIANRLWHRFLGHGLVMPLDQMHSENPPSHPELLDWLARDTRDHGYDLRRLMRGIVMSRTYSRGSVYPSEEHPHAKYFAVARLKPLTPLQYTGSLRIATRAPTVWAKLSPTELGPQADNHASAGGAFAGLLVEPNDDFQVGVSEALLFNNGDRFAKEFLSDSPETLLGSLKDVSDPAELAARLVKATYGREPTDDEKAALIAYLNRRTDRLPEARRQMLWALLTAAEFRFCH